VGGIAVQQVTEGPWPPPDPWRSSLLNISGSPLPANRQGKALYFWASHSNGAGCALTGEERNGPGSPCARDGIGSNPVGTTKVSMALPSFSLPLVLQIDCRNNRV
jgi:hypothetical protein